MVNISKDTNISSYVIDGRERIPFLGYFYLDNDTVGRLDIICIKAYGNIDYLPLLLDFNNITDVSSTEVSDKVIVPDFNNILGQHTENNIINMDKYNGDVDDVDVPGISRYSNNQLPDNKASSDGINQTSSDSLVNDNNTGNLKLGIKSNSVSYDSVTEILRF